MSQVGDGIDLFQYGEAIGDRLNAKLDKAPGFTAGQDHGEFLSERGVAKRYGVHRSTIWRWVHGNPTFPKPIKLAPGTSRWRLSDLLRFEAVCPEVCRLDQRSSTKGR